MKKGRPKKPRLVQAKPNTRQFSPRGHIGRPGYIELKLEELEAIRLVDFAGLKQRESAQSMGISQQTFSRILMNGRKSLAKALVLAKIIKIIGESDKVERRPS